MNGLRQVFLGVFMAFLFSALVLGSLSLSLLEGGYALIPASTSYSMQFQFGTATYMPGISTPTATQCAAHPADWLAYTIHPDDTLRSLAEIYHVDEATLAKNNCLMVGLTTLRSDSTLYVPPLLAQATATHPPASPTPCQPPRTWVSYVVRWGDTWYNLGARVGYTAKDLQRYNCLPGSEPYIGQVIRLPFYIAVYPTATYWRPPTTVWRPSATPSGIFPPTWTPANIPPSVTPVPPTATFLPPTEPPAPTLPPPPTPTEALPITLPPPVTEPPPVITTEPPPPSEPPPVATTEPPPPVTEPPPVATEPPPPVTQPPPLPTEPPVIETPPVVEPPPVETQAPVATQVPAQPSVPVQTPPPEQPILFHPSFLISAIVW